MDYSKKILEFFNEEIVTIFKDTINTYCKNKRTPKYSIEYYLYNIVLVMKETTSWKSLNKFYDFKPYHYKTINKIHLKWSKLNIYNIVYNKLLQKNILDKLKGSKNLTLFIDSTNIYNKNGSENVGFGANPKKKESKLSIICDEHKNVLSLTLVNTNKKISNYTLPHDSKTTTTSINDLLKNKFKCNKIFLIGDKGYILNEKNKQILFKKYKIEIVHPHRKNQKKKTSKKHKKLLKKRYVVENVISKLKQCNRVCFRKDRLKSTYIGFCFLALVTFLK